MIKETISAICLLLVFLSLVALAYYIILKILRPKKSGKYIVVISADDSSDDAADRLCSEYMRLEMLGEISFGNVVLLDLGMSYDERRRCEELCRETKNVYVCELRELEALTEKLIV